MRNRNYLRMIKTTKPKLRDKQVTERKKFEHKGNRFTD